MYDCLFKKEIHNSFSPPFISLFPPWTFVPLDSPIWASIGIVCIIMFCIIIFGIVRLLLA